MACPYSGSFGFFRASKGSQGFALFTMFVSGIVGFGVFPIVGGSLGLWLISLEVVFGLP